MVIPMYETARVGPNFPLSVLRNRDACLSCGYRKVCYGNKGNTLLSAVVQRLIHKNERDRSFLTPDRMNTQSFQEGPDDQ
jgi:hypothetical protein